MDDLKTEVNAYLFMEFGVDGDESRVSEVWPFELELLLEAPDLTVFGFQADEDSYFAVAEASLNFLPQAGMSVDDLLLQRSGARWIAARDPVDLSTVRLGDPGVPSTVERRRRIEALGAEMFPGQTVKILEGLFLRTEQRYLVLFGKPATGAAAIGGLPETPAIPVPFPLASAWRRLAWGVGYWLQQQNSTG